MFCGVNIDKQSASQTEKLQIKTREEDKNLTHEWESRVVEK